MRVPASIRLIGRPARGIALLAGTAAVAALLGGLHLRRSGLAIPVPQDIPRTNLERRDGRYFPAGSRIPFSGTMTEHYDTGALKSRVGVADGLVDGLAETWFTNGQKQIEERFRAGVAHGARVRWDSDGHRISEAPITDGQIEGVFRRFHPDGSVAEEIAMSGGAPHGVSRAFYPSGCLRAEAMLDRGTLKTQHFWADGARPVASVKSSPRSTSPNPLPP
jgi:hypothetical protein